MKKRMISVIANAAWGPLLSGGDNIFIEFCRRWAALGHKVRIFCWEEGRAMCARQKLTDVEYVIGPAARFKKFGLAALTLARVVIGGRQARRADWPADAVVYSASDFWPDALPACLVKRRRPHVRWIAGFYLFAPAPWQGDSPYRGRHALRGFLYWLTQKLSYRLVLRGADGIFVTSEPDKTRFVSAGRRPQDIFVVRGGVDTAQADAYLSGDLERPKDAFRYAACFVARLHPQKGALELVDIWQRVARADGGARLVVIGDGPLDGELRGRIRRRGLDPLIDVVGFKTGEEKYALFRASRLVVHPATYDSGGMAAAEAMAWGLPGVGFDLESLKTYYPKGMLKVPRGDLDAFAAAVESLLKDEALYARLSREASSLIREKWLWKDRAEEALAFMESL